MPDYDPKSIPILDDIIEDEKTTIPGKISDVVAAIDIADDIIDQDDSNTDLFNSRENNFSSVDADTTKLDSETAEPEIGSIDRFIETADTGKIETETAESALIDYHPEIEDDTADSLDQYEIQQADLDDIEDLAVEPFQPEAAQEASRVTTQAIALETIVDDVVKQLLPELEQRLRLLLQQALEEKLPAELLEQLSAEDND